MKAIFIVGIVLGFLFAGCAQEETSAEEWEAIHTACTDSDFGQDEFSLGTASGPTGSGTDRCLGDGEKVLEYYCSGGEIEHINIACPEHYSCSDGACKQITCFDTDYGKDTSAVGTVNYGEQYVDACVGDTVVREYFCGANGSVGEEEIACPENHKCSLGKCVALAICTDSDGDDEGQIKGTTTLDSATYEDKCLGYDVVYEYYCENGTLQTKQVTCLEGQACEDGICVDAVVRECKDTDEGKSVYSKGKVTYWSQGEKYSEVDKCYDQNSVLEVWCTESGSVGFGIISCDSGDWCEDGRCTGP